MIALIAASMRDLMPRGGALPGIADTDVTGFLRRLRREASRDFWFGLLLGAIVYELTPILTVRVPLPAFALPVELRDAHARRVVESKSYLIRQAVFLVRLSAGLCWGCDPAVRACFALPAYPPDPGTFRTS